MNAFAILLPVIFPIIAGACLLPVKFSDRKARQRVVLPIIVLNAIFALYDFRYDGISALDSHNDLCL